jgi:hypothetical protein
MLVRHRFTFHTHGEQTASPATASHAPGLYVMPLHTSMWCPSSSIAAGQTLTILTAQHLYRTMHRYATFHILHDGDIICSFLPVFLLFYKKCCFHMNENASRHSSHVISLKKLYAHKRIPSHPRKHTPELAKRVK